MAVWLNVEDFIIEQQQTIIIGVNWVTVVKSCSFSFYSFM